MWYHCSMDERNFSPPPLTWEYLAGLFDGEGCIYFSERPGGRRYVMVNITQGVVNDDASRIILDIHEFLTQHGIKAGLTSHAASNPLWKGGRKVSAASSHAVRDWLEGMFPYLRIKRAQAAGALTFLEGITAPWLTAAEDREIKTLRESGLNIIKIAESTGRSKGTVKRSLTRQGAYVPFGKG